MSIPERSEVVDLCQRFSGQHSLKQLSAVRMVVGVPDQESVAVRRRIVRPRTAGLFGPAKQVTVIDCGVLGEQHVALPTGPEHAFGITALISGAGVDGAPTRGRSRDDLHGMGFGVGNDSTERRHRRLVCNDQRDLEDRQAVGYIRVQVIERRTLNLRFACFPVHRAVFSSTASKRSRKESTTLSSWATER